MKRRSFLGGGLAAASGVAALTAALSPLRHLNPDDYGSWETLFQKHYKDMSPQDMEEALNRIREEVKRRYEVPPDVRDVKHQDGVHACVKENNQSREPEIQYIRVLEMPRGTTNPEHGDHRYDRAKVPDDNHFYMPVQCHQCKNPPCVKVCPVEATWQEPDGITVIDYDWCIGCRYCEAACPYWARRFNFATPKLPM